MTGDFYGLATRSIGNDHLHPDRPSLTLRHTLRNEGLWSIELAPWGLTQMRLGGVAILPQQVGALDEAGLLPNRQIVFWPYTSSRDARLRLDDDFVLVETRPAPPCKIGYMNRSGWIGYLRGAVLFCKRFQPQPDEPHPDLGCNVEIYCNDQFVEVESVGKLSRLEPGRSLTHVETWEFHTGVAAAPTIEGVRKLVGELGL